ncbi:MAG: hypothetical protein HRU19_17475 [Pseudobacteriovorax sp.]|nr:hypothetical protein [Pseudobacteriovorax sp.]
MVKLLKYLENLKDHMQKRHQYERLADLYSDSKKHRRRYHRHSLRNLNGCIFKVNDVGFELVDISYEGLRIAFPDQAKASLPKIGKVFSGTISILGMSCRSRMVIVHYGENYCGIKFDNEDTSLVGYLESTLYYLDAGLVMKRIPRNAVNHFYQSPSWNSYGSFNNCVEVHIRFGEEEQLDEVNISYLKGLRKEFVVFTSKATTVSTFPETNLDIVAKKKILRRTLLIITGFRQIGGTSHFDGLIESAIILLKK